MHSILHSAATSYSTGILHKSHKGFISLKKPFLEERFFLVEIAGFEPVTSCVWSRRSNQLS